MTSTMMTKNTKKFLAVVLSLSVVAPAPAVFAAGVGVGGAAARDMVGGVGVGSAGYRMPHANELSRAEVLQRWGNLSVVPGTWSGKPITTLDHVSEGLEGADFSTFGQEAPAVQKAGAGDSLAQSSVAPLVSGRIQDLEKFFRGVIRLAENAGKPGVPSVQKDFQALTDRLNQAYDARVASENGASVVGSQLQGRPSRGKALSPATHSSRAGSPAVAARVASPPNNGTTRSIRAVFRSLIGKLLKPFASDMFLEHHLLRYLEKYLVLLEQNRQAGRKLVPTGFNSQQFIETLALNYLFEDHRLGDYLPNRFLGWALLHAAQIGHHDDKWALWREGGAFAVTIRGTTPKLRSFLGDGKTAQIDASGTWGQSGPLKGRNYALSDPAHEAAGVHHGFAELVEFIWPDVSAQLGRYRYEIEELVGAGHSRGASGSALLANKLRVMGLLHKYTGYFVAPAKLGNQWFAHEWDRFWAEHPGLRAFFIINPEDVVPDLPFTLQWFHDMKLNVTPAMAFLFKIIGLPETIFFSLLKFFLISLRGLPAKRSTYFAMPTQEAVKLPLNHTMTLSTEK